MLIYLYLSFLINLLSNTVNSFFIPSTVTFLETYNTCLQFFNLVPNAFLGKSFMQLVSLKKYNKLGIKDHIYVSMKRLVLGF